MRFLRVVAILAGLAHLAFGAPARAQEGGDGPLLRGDDKLAHFGVSAAGTSGMIKIFQAFEDDHRVTPGNRVTSAVLMLIAGFAKEADDVRRHGNSVLRDSRGDFTADVLGTVTGEFIQWQF